MMDDELKSKVQKNVKEKIAISNIRKEVCMENKRNRKIMYVVLSSCAMFVLCAGILISKTPLEQSNDGTKQAKVENSSKTDKALKTEIYINEKNVEEDYRIDAQLKKFDAKEINVDLRFAIEAKLPNDFEKNYSVTGIYVKGKNSKQYDELQNYEFYYSNKSETRSITLGLGFKDKKPLRDYLFLEVEKKSRIGDVELEITKYEDSYLVIFSHKDVNYDIETRGINETELLEFLTSLISNSKSYEQMTAKDMD